MSKNKGNLAQVIAIIVIIIGVVVLNYINDGKQVSESHQQQKQMNSVETTQPFNQPSSDSTQASTLAFSDDSQKIQNAFQQQLNDVQVRATGTLKKILPDDNKGSRHQRLILELSTGDTILIAHNIDLAPRVQNLSLGDTIEFYGVYEYNSQGGVVHWTHHDPQGQHIGGWLKHQNKRYE